MKKRKVKQEMQELLNKGIGKSEIYKKYQDNGLPEKKLALMVTALPDPFLCQKYEKMNNLLILVMFVQASIAALIGFDTGALLGGHNIILFGLIGIAVPVLFIIGFYRYSLTAYNAFLILGIIQFPRLFKDIGQVPVFTTLVVVFSILSMGYVWFLKSRLYPDSGLFGVKKKGRGYFQLNQ
ncbi:hypothetical protein [Endozoicomonas sp. ALB032]|uniref:hypothetical protein n=1 Tax=Endozoicomonas sp. ALB032 TaxID=3403082 RepID=UPI003BB7E83E